MSGSSPSTSSSGPPDGRHQLAGFSIFVDQVLDDAEGQRWEARLYHAECGVETTLAGASPEQWIGWMLEHLGQEPQPAAPQEATRIAVEVLAIEVLDVTLNEESDSRGETTHTIAAQIVIQLGGLGRLERRVGARVLSQLARLWPPEKDTRTEEESGLPTEREPL